MFYSMIRLSVFILLVDRIIPKWKDFSTMGMVADFSLKVGGFDLSYDFGSLGWKLSFAFEVSNDAWDCVEQNSTIVVVDYTYCHW